MWVPDCGGSLFTQKRREESKRSGTLTVGLSNIGHYFHLLGCRKKECACEKKGQPLFLLIKTKAINLNIGELKIVGDCQEKVCFLQRESTRKSVLDQKEKLSLHPTVSGNLLAV